MLDVVTSDLERLLSRCHQEGECLLWDGALVRGLYGAFYPSGQNHRQVYVHRFVYEHARGPVPEGLELDHTCKNTRCVNIAHLEAVTHKENLRRARLAVCRSGRHDLTDPANVRWDADGNRRGCLRCWQERQDERRKPDKVGSNHL